jgi:hypothetical protein
MKKLLFTLLISFSCYSLFSQETKKFELTAKGYESVIYTVENQNQAEIYALAKKWVIKTYKNPNTVLSADLANESLKINGFAKGIVKWDMGDGWNLNYTLTIDFKDNKYRLNIDPDIDGNQIEWASFFKSDGTKKGGYKGGPDSMDKYFNTLSDDLYMFVKTKGDSSGSNNW